MDLRIKLSLVTVAVLTLGFASAQTPNRLPAPAGETYADLPGVRIWFRDTGGSGISVVFMHAATGSSRNWDEAALTLRPKAIARCKLFSCFRFGEFLFELVDPVLQRR